VLDGDAYQYVLSGGVASATVVSGGRLSDRREWRHGNLDDRVERRQ